jgi:hypothetical protein
MLASSIKVAIGSGTTGHSMCPRSQGQQVAAQSAKFKIAPLGQETIYSNFNFPKTTGEFLLRAVIKYSKNGKDVSTQSRRQVKLVESKKEQIAK